jgi:catechol 2,3-dioxygenase-like lactoylglutathione lyase family enzyme
MDMKLEVIVVPVADVDRAKAFYRNAGFREDIDHVAGDDFRVVQFTPPGSEASIIIGTGITTAAPGSLQGLQLVVQDVIGARDDLIARGVDVGEVFHDRGGIFYHLAPEFIASGPAPDRGSYGSFARFSDPDGNGWVLQEVRQRAPGR